MRTATGPHSNDSTRAENDRTTSRRPDIQGLRAIAVVMVVAYHAGLPVPGGFVGVDVFFVISGFVIVQMLQREWNSTGKIDFRQFYLRRFKRLTPALALMLAVVIVAAAFILSPLGSQQTAAKTTVGAILLLANLVIARTTGGYFDAPAETNPLLHCWSLSVEEQFYLLFPALLAACWAWGRYRSNSSPQRIALIGVVAVTLVSVIFSSLNVLAPDSRSAHYLANFYSPLSRAWEFGAGALLAVSGMSGRRFRRSVCIAMSALGLAALAVSGLIINGSVAFPGPWTALPVAGSVLLLLGGGRSDHAVAKVLGSRPFAKAGDWSYSIYLWHWPFIVFAGLLWPGDAGVKLAAAMLSVVPALASFRWLEEPLRARQDVGAHRVFSMVLATVLPTLVLALGLAAGSRVLRSMPGVAEARVAVSTRHAPSERGCLSRGPFSPDLVKACWWNGDVEASPIYLVGDSNAWHFAEAVLGAAHSLQRPAWIFTTPSCPLIQHLEIRAVGRSPYFPQAWPLTEFAHCTAYARFTIDSLAQATPGVVVIAGLDQYWWDPTLSVRLGTGQPVVDSVGKARVFREGIAATVSRLEAAGHRVVLVQSIPTFRNPAPPWDPRACTNVAVLRGTCGRTVPVAVIEPIQEPSRQALSEAATLTGSHLLDLRNVLCPDGLCSTHRGREWLYMDATHLSVQTSRELAPFFVQAIDAASR